MPDHETDHETDHQTHDRDPRHLRAGVGVSSLSIVWTVVASGIGVAVGAASGSLVVLAFGLTGLLDAAGSAALVLHFRHALRHETFSARRERIAHRFIHIGLVTVSVSTAAASALRLAERSHLSEPPIGITVAAASVVVLAALAWRKRAIARRIRSGALMADARLSAIGGLIAAVTVAGASITRATGWWWLDPVAAIVVAAVALSAVWADRLPTR